MKTTKKALLFLATLTIPTLASAYEVVVGGMTYDVVKKARKAVLTKGIVGDVVVPATIEYEDVTCNVVEIADRAFLQGGLTSVNIAEGIKKIGAEAFSYCRSLTSATIPESVTEIGANAFYGTGSLKSIKLPSQLKRIEYETFRYSGLITVDMPESLTYIGEGAFRLCEDLSSIAIPNKVTEIGAYAFNSCNSLTTINIPNSVTTIKDYAFLFCNALTAINIPSSVTSIGTEAFKGCPVLAKVTIANGITSISDGTFRDCVQLSTVSLPNTITIIGNYAFAGCTSLVSPPLPNSLLKIKDYAFLDCTMMKFAIIPNKVTEIGNSAFRGCMKMESVSWGTEVVKIGDECFSYCDDLADVTSLAEVAPATSSNAFTGSLPEYITLHIPEGSIYSYRGKDPWGAFMAIETLGGDNVLLPARDKCETPIIAYNKGKLTLKCATTEADFVTRVTTTDGQTVSNNNEVELSRTYNISVVATREGYDDSDPATATITWKSGIATGFSTVTFDDGSTTLTGDINNDGKVNIVDVTTLIDTILKAK